MKSRIVWSAAVIALGGFAVQAAAQTLPAGNTIVLDLAFRAVAEADVAADAQWTACATPEALRRRQASVRAELLQAIGGLPQVAAGSVPGRVTATVARKEYAIEKVLIAAATNYHITAHVFRPNPFRFPGRRPGVAIPCGHSLNGKAEASYQRGALMAAQRGIVALLYDPLGQGERLQNRGKAPLACCEAHNEIGRRAELLGWSMARFRIADGMRVIDYLASRGDVDPARLGVMGHSGGGTMTSWLMCLDDRVRAAAPSGFLSTLRDVCREIGPQDAEQFVFGELKFGFNHLGHILLRAPSPVLMCASHADFFPITGSLTTSAAAAGVYAMLGRADDFRFSDVTGPHHWHESTRTYAVDWMDRKLQLRCELKSMADYRRLDFGFSESSADTGLSNAPRGVTDLCTNSWASSVTPSGQVLALAGERSVYDLMRDEAARQRGLRAALTPETVRRVAGIRAPEAIGFTFLQHALQLDDGTPVVLRVSGRRRQSPTVLYVAEGGATPSFAGETVLAADIRGFGENGTLRHVFYGIRSADEELAVLYHLLGDKLVGKRAEDIIAVAKYMGNRPKLVAQGRAAIPAAHAYYVARELFSGIEIREAPPSWGAYLADDALGGRFADVVRGAWAHYDWTDLVSR